MLLCCSSVACCLFVFVSLQEQALSPSVSSIRPSPAFLLPTQQPWITEQAEVPLSLVSPLSFLICVVFFEFPDSYLYIVTYQKYIIFLCLLSMFVFPPLLFSHQSHLSQSCFYSTSPFGPLSPIILSLFSLLCFGPFSLTLSEG